MISKDGGATWSTGGTITRDIGEGPPGFHCCLASARRRPGDWSAARQLEFRRPDQGQAVLLDQQAVVGSGRRHPPDKSLLGVSSDVSGYNGTVSVAYGLTTQRPEPWATVRRHLPRRRPALLAADRGRAADQLRYAAVAGGIFPRVRRHGHDEGQARSGLGRPGKPPTTGAKYHQVSTGPASTQTAARSRLQRHKPIEPW